MRERTRRQVEFERLAENLAVGFYVTVRCLEMRIVVFYERC